MTHTASSEPNFRKVVTESWHRCIEEYQLERDRIPKAELITSHELRDKMTPYEDLMASAHQEMETLFRRLTDNDYIVSMAAPDGLKLSIRCDQHFLGDMTSFGVLPGSFWREDSQGTNGIGTALRCRRAVSINGKEHFSLQNRDLSCHAAPVFGPDGMIEAVLNVTCAHDEDARTAKLVLDMLRRSAGKIEHRQFSRRNRHHHLFTLALAGSDRFAQLAVDDLGRVVASSSGAEDILGGMDASSLTGLRLDAVLDVPPMWQDRDRLPVELPGLGHAVLTRLAEGPKPPRPPRVDPVDAPVAVPRGTFCCHETGMMAALSKAEKLCAAGVPILITGDTGTGKTAVAHHLAACAGLPVVSLYCGGLDPSRPALSFAEIGGPGVLVLEALHDLPPMAQTALMNLIADDRILNRRGMHLVATSARSSDDLLKSGQIRADILHRLAGWTLPCVRLNAYAHLEAQIAATFAAAFGEPVKIEPDAAAILRNHHWPGNLRELNLVAQTARVLSEGGVVRLHHLPGHLLETLLRDNISARSQSEAARIEAALDYHSGNVTKTARYLGVSRSTLYRKIPIGKFRSS